MTVTTFSFPYVNTPAFFSGSGSTSLVPNVFPVGINGRPYQVDQKSGRFSRGYEPRVRDSQDISTAPGEAAINPGGLWRRGQDSWHLGAGQKYADAATAIDYRFYKSKGVDPWSKGQLSLLNDVKRSLYSSSQNLMMCTVKATNGTEYVYVADGNVVRFSEDPFTYISATITNVTESSGTITYTTSSAHGFTAGQIVDITGIDPVAYNLTGATIATASGTTFTVTDPATGTYVSGGTAVQRPVWTPVTTNTAGGNVPNTVITGLETNGENVFIGWTSNDIWYTTPGSTSATLYFQSGSSNLGNGLTYNAFGYAKNTGWAAVDNNLFAISPSSSPAATAPKWVNPDPSFRFVGAAAGQNAAYIAGYAGEHSIIFKVTITSAGVLDTPVAALELPIGEIVSGIGSYLGFILVGSNKGVRFCTPDSQNNLTAGPLIATGSDVYDFVAEDRFVWFTYTNYDGSSGLGRLDLSNFTGPNTPAYATDLMYGSSTNAVKAVTELDSKRIFSISGVGVVVEDADNLVDSGTIEVGTYRWGIPDRKFVAKVDTRSQPLNGSIRSFLSLDNGAYAPLGTWSTSGDTENTLDGLSDKTIEASFKFELRPSDTNVSPVMTRWMTRAYAAPFRSQVFAVPLLLHRKVRVGNKDYYFDTNDERSLFDDLISSPRIVTLQIGRNTHTVIVEDVEEIPLDSSGNVWDFEGTLVVTMRSVEN